MKWCYNLYLNVLNSPIQLQNERERLQHVLNIDHTFFITKLIDILRVTL